MLFITKFRSKKNKIMWRHKTFLLVTSVTHTHSGSPYQLNNSQTTDLYPIETMNDRLATKPCTKKPEETKEFYIIQRSSCFDQHQFLSTMLHHVKYNK
jgi:hypothetical protein